MNQQVNLLAPMFRKPHALLSARVAVALAVPVLAVLVALYGVSAWRSAALRAEQAALEQRRGELTQRLTQLAEELKGRSQSQQLAAELATLTAERDRKAQALVTLSRRDVGSTRGFSPHFTGLARQRLNGLWLTHVEFGAGGGQLALRGVALDEALIPRYLGKLGSEDVFKGLAFRQARFERGGSGGDELRFELRTDAAGGAR